MRTVQDASGVRHIVLSVVDSAKVQLFCGPYLYNSVGVIDETPGTVTCLACVAGVDTEEYDALKDRY